MSVIAVGPALAIDGPLPRPPKFGLLSIPGVLVSGDGDRWINGVNVNGYPTETPETWEPCATGTFRTKADGTAPPVPRFDAFGMYVPITCSAGYMGNWQEFSARAGAVLEATQSWGVERALSQGVAGSLNPFFVDGNETLPAPLGAAQKAEAALAILEEAIGTTGRAGMIHAPPIVASLWDLIEDGDFLRTNLGTPVAVGGGYSGADSDLWNVPAAGNHLAFATGPVEVHLSDLQMVGDDINGTLDTTSNDVTFRAEKFAIAIWDTALQAIVEVDISPCCSGEIV